MRNPSRLLALALALFCALTVATVASSRASDNWLVGKWTTSNGLTLNFTDTTYTMTGPGGSVGPYKCTYAVAADTVTLTPTEGDDKDPISVKKVDATHATMPFTDGTTTTTITLTKE